MENPEKELKKWWNYASDYYQKEIDNDKMSDVNYGPFGSNENKLRLLGNVKKKNILELGCGGGQVSISLAKKGAKCIGIDVSDKQIAIALKNAKKEKVDVDFKLMPFSAIEKLGKERFDIIISVMALQYCGNLKKLLNSANKLLKSGGKFVFSIEHPFYLLINPNNMEIEESYFSEGLRRETEQGRKENYIYFHRKLSTILNQLIKNGFKIKKLVEPLEKHDRIWGIGYRMALVNRIGPTIIFSCVKNK